MVFGFICVEPKMEKVLLIAFEIGIDETELLDLNWKQSYW